MKDDQPDEVEDTRSRNEEEDEPLEEEAQTDDLAPNSRRHFLRSLGAMTVLGGLSGTFQPATGSNSADTDQQSVCTAKGHDAWCGQAPQQVGVTEDFDCPTTNSDQDCGKYTGHVFNPVGHNDADCGQPGAVGDPEDADCGISTMTGSAFSDQDCGVGGEDNDCGMTMGNSDADCVPSGGAGDADSGTAEPADPAYYCNLLRPFLRPLPSRQMGGQGPEEVCEVRFDPLADDQEVAERFGLCR